MLHQPGGHPPVRHRGRDGDAEAGQRAELAAGGGISVDAGNHEGTHDNNLAPAGSRTKGSAG